MKNLSVKKMYEISNNIYSLEYGNTIIEDVNYDNYLEVIDDVSVMLEFVDKVINNKMCCENENVVVIITNPNYLSTKKVFYRGAFFGTNVLYNDVLLETFTFTHTAEKCVELLKIKKL